MSYTNGDDPSLDAEVEGRKARRRGEPLDTPNYLTQAERTAWTAGWVDEDLNLRNGEGGA
jgi:hypothetical protein